MRVAVLGMGAVGTVVAGALDPDVCEVICCRRDRRTPMSLDHGGHRMRVEGMVVCDPDEAGTVDWLLLATKAVDDPGAWLDRLVGPSTKIAVLQGGLDLHSRVSKWIPASRMVAVSVSLSAEKTGPDEVTLSRLHALTTRVGDLSAEFANLFRPGLPVRAASDYRTVAWKRLMVDVVSNSLTTLTGGAVAACVGPALLPLTRALLTETVHVAESTGAMLSWREVDEALRLIGTSEDSSTPMQRDLRGHRPFEHDFLTGAVMEQASSVAVRVPMITAIHALLEELSPNRDEPDQKGSRRRRESPVSLFVAGLGLAGRVGASSSDRS